MFPRRPVTPCLVHGARSVRRLGGPEAAVVIVVVVLSGILIQTGMREPAALRLLAETTLLGGVAVRMAAAGPAGVLRLAGRVLCHLGSQG